MVEADAGASVPSLLDNAFVFFADTVLMGRIDVQSRVATRDFQSEGYQLLVAEGQLQRRIVTSTYVN